MGRGGLREALSSAPRRPHRALDDARIVVLQERRGQIRYRGTNGSFRGLSRLNRRETAMASKNVILIMALLASAAPAFAQGAGGGAGGGAAGGGSAGVSGSANGASVGATGGTSTAVPTTPGAQFKNNTSGTSTTTNSPQPTGTGSASSAQSAVNGSSTLPSSSPNTVSAPGVGVGHSANGQPIGTPGSGVGSPQQPVDSGARK